MAPSRTDHAAAQLQRTYGGDVGTSLMTDFGKGGGVTMTSLYQHAMSEGTIQEKTWDGDGGYSYTVTPDMQIRITKGGRTKTIDAFDPKMAFAARAILAEGYGSARYPTMDPTEEDQERGKASARKDAEALRGRRRSPPPGESNPDEEPDRADNESYPDDIPPPEEPGESPTSPQVITAQNYEKRIAAAVERAKTLQEIKRITEETQRRAREQGQVQAQTSERGLPLKH